MSVPAAKLATIRDGARLAGMLPYLEDELERLRKQAEQKVFKAIDDGTFTPEAAYLAWLERHAHARLLRGLGTRVKIGQSTGDTYSEQLTEGMN